MINKAVSWNEMVKYHNSNRGDGETFALQRDTLWEGRIGLIQQQGVPIPASASLAHPVSDYKIIEFVMESYYEEGQDDEGGNTSPTGRAFVNYLNAQISSEQLIKATQELDNLNLVRSATVRGDTYRITIDNTSTELILQLKIEYGAFITKIIGIK